MRKGIFAVREKIILDGLWDFAFSEENMDRLPENFKDVMTVPGCFDLMEPYCGKRGIGVYHRKVAVGGLVRLFIEGTGLQSQVWFDGRLIGQCPYAYMPEEFVFDAGADTIHELVIVSDNRYNDSFHPNFDFFGYGGVYGTVFMEKLPELWIKKLFITTEDYLAGTVRIQSELSQSCNANAFLSFDGKDEFPLEFENGRLDITIKVPDFKLWSPDEPNLHRLVLRTDCDMRQENFGIRHVARDGRKILLNGKEIKLFGYNRHESHPEFGAATPVTLMAADLRMLKKQGGNFIRGSHYPQRRSFLELCDTMGVLVWEETLSWGTEAPELHTPEFLQVQKEQAAKLTEASFNHPSIIIRGFMNENDSSLPETRTVIQEIYRTIRSIDSKSLISFASNRYEKDLCLDLVDVVSMNPYPGWYDASYEEIDTVDKVYTRLKELSDAMPADKPFLVTEIGCEALYGFRDPLNARWTEEYQSEVLAEVCRFLYEDNGCAGVSIWLFADTRSFVTGPQIFLRARGFNNKGVLDEYRRPKQAWKKISDILEKLKGGQES